VLRSFAQVDVFTATAYRGNPVAVVLHGQGLSDVAMQAFTDWTNLSEATFILPPTDPAADYQLRIFCPGRELPFAGHPTLGSAHAWLESGGVPRDPGCIVQQCRAGLIPIRRDAHRLSFAAPPLIRSGPLAPELLADLLSGLGLQRDDVVDHAWCDNGPPWEALLLRSAQRLATVRPDPIRLAGRFVGLAALSGPDSTDTHPADLTQSHALEVRAFFPGAGGLTVEDPVTGSLNAALAEWLMSEGRLRDRYVASQGRALGREGRILLERDSQGTVWVGGQSLTCIRGEVAL